VVLRAAWFPASLAITRHRSMAAESDGSSRHGRRHKTPWSAGFDAAAARVRFGANYN
jgi:hypothetical protein